MKDEGENQDTDNQANDNMRAVPRERFTGLWELREKENSE